MTLSTAVALSTMSAESVSEPACRTDDDVLARLAAIDHRLHQISTHLTPIGQLLSQLAEIHTTSKR